MKEYSEGGFILKTITPAPNRNNVREHCAMVIYKGREF